jgi:hypothetical protein
VAVGVAVGTTVGVDVGVGVWADAGAVFAATRANKTAMQKCSCRELIDLGMGVPQSALALVSEIAKSRNALGAQAIEK